MGKKLVLDTNILISALGWEGNARIILQKVIDGQFELLISAKQLEELLRAMNYPKFKFTEDQKTRFISVLMEVATIVEVVHKADIIKEDPSDNMHLECALSGKADYIITGDNKHLLKLKVFEGIRIIKAREFLDQVR